MKPRILCIIGLILLIIGQSLLAQGFDFLQSQSPIDFAHWALLLGAVFLINFNRVFPKGIINTIASSLTTIGVIASIGMCAVDILLWSYGTNYESRDAVVSQLFNTPSLYLPFFVIGPSCLYIGLSFHAWQFIRTHPISSLMTLIGSLLVGVGLMVFQHGIMMILGIVLFAAGLIALLYRKEEQEVMVKMA